MTYLILLVLGFFFGAVWNTLYILAAMKDTQTRFVCKYDRIRNSTLNWLNTYADALENHDNDIWF